LKFVFDNDSTHFNIKNIWVNSSRKMYYNIMH